LVARIRSFYAFALIAIAFVVAVESCAAVNSGQAIISRTDDSIFTANVALAKTRGIDKMPIGLAVAESGKLFLGSPYVGGTLDRDSLNEVLVVDLHEFDCVTFYENAFAFARALKLHTHPALKDFEEQLALLRYRAGIRNGFASRLHYSTDYFFDAAKKNVLLPSTDLARPSPVVNDDRTIDFMSSHRSSYAQLRSSQTNFRAIVGVEAAMAHRGGFLYIPKDRIASIESSIETGDIIGITTNIKGLDCSHTGIAVRMPDGQIHFMHASSLHHEVIISDEPLAEYLTHSNSQTGIIVNRPIEPTTN
jgi:hypothetical protein